MKRCQIHKQHDRSEFMEQAPDRPTVEELKKKYGKILRKIKPDTPAEKVDKLLKSS